MPYIDPERRLPAAVAPTSAGELNLAVTALVDDYLMAHGPLRYELLNEVVGVLESAKLELYRRVVAPYEDRKMAQNGDVYECLKEDT